MKKNGNRIESQNGYAFVLESAQEIINVLRDDSNWYKWSSEDGRFVVCCDDSRTGLKRHTVNIFQKGESPYRPEVYCRNCDDCGSVHSVVVRHGSDNGGLCSLEEIDRYIQELVVTRTAVEAIQELFIRQWDTIKEDIPVQEAPPTQETHGSRRKAGERVRIRSKASRYNGYTGVVVGYCNGRRGDICRIQLEDGRFINILDVSLETLK